MRGLFSELRRRNVFRVTAAYLVIGWLLLQVADTVIPALHLPEWIISAITLVLILGFIPTMLFSWAYELTHAIIPGDHAVSWSRFQLIETVLDWAVSCQAPN